MIKCNEKNIQFAGKSLGGTFFNLTHHALSLLCCSD